VVNRRPGADDRWADDYPLADELDPLRAYLTRGNDQAGSDLFTHYMIRETSTGRAVGGAGFFGPPDDSGTVTIGYGLVASARGRGYATEAVRCLLDLARRGGARRVNADTSIDNTASRNVLFKTGFTEMRRTLTDAYFTVSLLAPHR